MKEFLYVIRPMRPTLVVTGPTDQESAVLREHEGYLDRLAREGVVELAGRTQNQDESAFGIVVFRAATEGEADRIMRADPAVARGIMSARLYPYRVAYRRATAP